MAFSISNKEVLSYSPETVWGTTDATPAFTFLRYVSNSFKADTTSVMSKEIINAREVSDHIRTQVKGGGSFNFELSYGNLDGLLPSIMGQTAWATNVLTIGSTKSSFSIERGFTDINQFELYKGAIPNSLTINVGIGKVIDGSMGFVANTLTSSGTTAASSTVAAPTNSVMNPIDSIQLVQESATPMVGVVGFTMTLANQIVEFPQLASVNFADLESGQIAASGTIDIYWQDATYLTKYLAWTTTSLSFTLGGVSSQKYNFLFSKVKLSQAETPNGGMNQPLITKFNWVAFKDAANTTLKITRTP